MRAGRHLLDLVDEVLDISRIESGQLSVSPEPVALDLALSEAVQLVVPMAGEKRVVFEERQSCAGSFVLADRQRLRQVLLNLLSNAVKYNRLGGSVVIDCVQIPEERIRISIADNGMGIAGPMLERIFSPFDRLGAEESGVEGTGLGLALSKGLVETMGGTMSVESVHGQGSTFSFDLISTDAPDSRLDQALFGTTATITSERTHTLLYIEDNLSNLRLIERVLDLRPNVRMLSAMQGTLGLALARQHLPELILLDLHLPDMKGEEVLTRLRSDPVTDSIPVAVISADATPGQVRRLIAAGVTAYLTKPLDLQEFLALVDRTLRAD